MVRLGPSEAPNIVDKHNLADACYICPKGVGPEGYVGENYDAMAMERGRTRADPTPHQDI
ncbi:hypothetical protein LTR24_004015 [Lithohypha guttulata]|uniref:Uncharacterized protein n=1 Tax=Lithohypha guttulata TaxID=1690604 RepID=A0ABR0KDB2_9EURO|nr:hypothetical protein LTR24_004015 [Lithohypha guttulata]